MSCSSMNKNQNLSSESSCSSESQATKPFVAFAKDASASELSYLKSQVWLLQHRLTQSNRSVQNFDKAFKTVANEKYELIQELTNQKLTAKRLHEELQHERENNSVLIGEIESLREEMDCNRKLLEKAVTQNIELKESIMMANETIQRMGAIYLRLKDCEHNSVN